MPKPAPNVATIEQRSVFRYPGGKTWFVPWLERWLHSIARCPRLFVEPFAGGGIASLTAVARSLVHRALIVEKDPVVATVWRVCLSKDAKALARKIRDFAFTEESVRGVMIETRPATDDLDAAFRVILLNRIRRGGVLANGAGVLKRGENGKGLASRWYPETLAKRVEAIHQLRSRIEFREGDGLKIIDEFSSWSSAAIYCDPPYTQAAKRLYTCWEFDHEGLFDRLDRGKGNVLLTYDNTAEVRKWARNAQLAYTKIPMKTTGHRIKQELVIGRDLTWLRR